MLTKESKLILNYLISAFSENETMISYSEIIENSGLPLHEVDSSLQFLFEENYLKLKRYKNGGFVLSLTHKGFHYEEFDSSSPVSQTNIFNAPVANSAVGNTGNITINNGISFSEIRSFIESMNISVNDKKEALQVIDYVETLTENEAPLKKGFLSKFKDTLSKLDWLPDLIGKCLVAYFSSI